MNICINNKMAKPSSENCSKRDKPTRTFRKSCAFGCDAESPIGNRLFVEIAELTKLVHYLGNQ